MARCVVCGKVLQGKVTGTHLRVHGHTKDEYAAYEACQTPEAWEYYWTKDGIQDKFPDPTEKKPAEGRRFTFATWWAEVGSKRHMWWARP